MTANYANHFVDYGTSLILHAKRSSFIPMTLPTLLLALLISILCGALYHFVRGGEESSSGWRLLLYFGASTLGFAVGQWVSVWQGWTLFKFGSLDIGMGLLGSLLLLALGEWLSRT